MKVLIVGTVMPIRGGIATWVNAIATKLNDMGIKTSVINSLGERESDFVLAPSALIKTAYRLLNSDIIFYIAYYLTRLLLKIRVYKELRKNTITVIHAQDVNACQAVSDLCKKKGIRLVMTLHGQFYKGGISSRKIDENTWLGRLLIEDEREAYRKADHIITVSKYTYDYVSLFVPQEILSLIRNFVDMDMFYILSPENKTKLRMKYNYQQNDVVLINVGRLAKGKGIQYLLEAISLIDSEISIKLILVGSGPEFVNLQRQSRELEIEKMVNFLGEVSLDKVNDLYNIADIFVLPAVSGESSFDLTPMSILEAKACGLPVVTTPSGGIKDLIVHNVNGLLVEERSATALTIAIERVCKDPELREKLIKKSLEEVKQEYSLDSVIYRILKIYQLEKIA